MVDPPRARTRIRCEIALDDGSRLLGVLPSGAVNLEGEIGRVAVPLAAVRRVTFRAEHETSVLHLWNGDRAVGLVDWEQIEIRTSLGPIRVDPAVTASLELGLGGIDLAARKPESATGDSFFLDEFRSTRPLPIGGRVRPRSQFVAAHAPGRVEYAFEEPVTEFHAIATMYDGYPATKGSVVFRVETPEGVVSESRRIGNRDREEVYARFRPTRRLVLVTDPAGSNQEDWSVWLRPEVR